MTTYNGHKSRNAWNVALWIGNDEGLYRLALDCIRRTRTRDAAAALMLSDLIISGRSATPDRVRYTKTSIRAALVGLA